MGSHASVPPKVRAALERIFQADIGAVQVIERSWLAQLHPRTRATTRRARIYLAGSAAEFFADPQLMLHEYCHVLCQWQTGRLTVARYLAEWLRHGYRANRFELEARAFAAAHAGRLRALIAACPAPQPSSASRR